MKPAQVRKVLRIVHLVLGSLLGFYVYAPIEMLGTFRLIGRVIVFPALVVTGLWMWQQARVRRWLSRGGATAGPSKSPRSPPPVI